MSIRTKLAAVLTVASSWMGLSASAQVFNEESDNTKEKMETVTNTAVTPSAPSIQDLVDTLHTQNNNVQEAIQDSIMRIKKKNLDDARELMLYVIAHFEGMKSQAYFDKAAKIWTINIGNTIRPDGAKVKSSDCIKTIDEALGYFDAHIDKHMANDMMEYLPLHLMNKEEIAVMGSLLYNCGSGILRNKDKTPSSFAQIASQYFTTHEDDIAQNFENSFMKFCRVRGAINKVVEERRQNELTFLRGDIKITIDENVNDSENVINLRKAILGTLYGCKGNPQTILSRFGEESKYYCPSDSLSVAIDKELHKPVRKQTYPTKRTKTGTQRKSQKRGR